MTKKFSKIPINWKDSKINFIIQYCEGKKVLDLGCVEHNLESSSNTNWIHRAVKEKAAEVLGLDYLKEEVEELNKKGYNILHGNAESFDLARKFDVIIAGDLIEHLNNYGDFIKCCVKHMHSESLLIITSANPWHWPKVIRSSFREVPINLEHTCWMTPNCLKQLCQRYGLIICNTRYGSSRLKDSFLPLPKRLRHSSWYSVLKLSK